MSIETFAVTETTLPSYEPRALIVEDETLIAEELKERLERFGFLVIAAVDTAEEGIQIATTERPDLVLMDVRLRGEKDGVQAAAEIRQRVDVPVIYLTAYSDRATLDRAKHTEPYGYVLKPFHERELQVTIELAMHRHALERKNRQIKQQQGPEFSRVYSPVTGDTPDAQSQGLSSRNHGQRRRTRVRPQFLSSCLIPDNRGSTHRSSSQRTSGDNLSQYLWSFRRKPKRRDLRRNLGGTGFESREREWDSQAAHRRDAKDQASNRALPWGLLCRQLRLA